MSLFTDTQEHLVIENLQLKQHNDLLKLKNEKLKQELVKVQDYLDTTQAELAWERLNKKELK